MNAAQLSKLSAITEEGGEMNVLIVALDVVPTEVRDAEVLVVAPALNSWLRHWLSDEDTARRRAEERVTAHLERLERSGVHAEGRVGDADPLLAIADALSTFPADEIVIAAGRNSTRLAEGLAARARELFALPTSHTADPRAAQRGLESARRITRPHDRSCHLEKGELVSTSLDPKLATELAEQVSGPVLGPEDAK
jgi:nucleotide-binding universal stress UspA family protein